MVTSEKDKEESQDSLPRNSRSKNSSALGSLASHLRALGPGVITGAPDDDPSGIATYSQGGAQFGLGMMWMGVFMYPLMTAVQEMCARIGLITGDGLGAVISRKYSKRVLFPLAGLLLIANTFNIGADIGAMSASARLIVPQLPTIAMTIIFTAFILSSEILIPYKSYVRILKYLSLALFAYIISAVIVGGDWRNMFLASVVPEFQLSPQYAMMFVAMLGTTISPYLFFWQASEEAEEDVSAGKIKEISNSEGPRIKKKEVRSMKIDIGIGMAFSQIISWCIIATTAGTLHLSAITNISTADQAAKALEPLVKTFPYSGEVAKTIFAAGVIGTGLLAVPVLAGSSAYALADGFGWNQGLYKKFRQAKAFYAVIVGSTLIDLWINFSNIDPIKALIYAAVINGAVAVPILLAVMKIANDKRILGMRTIGRIANFLGWFTVCLMGVSDIIMAIMWNKF